MSYYKTLDGKKLDSALLEMAEEAVKGAGDGRISKADAEMGQHFGLFHPLAFHVAARGTCVAHRCERDQSLVRHARTMRAG